MAIEGPNSAGMGSDDDSIGTVAWTDPNNITDNDENKAIADLPQGSVSHYLVASNFGFSIPNGATINGIKVELERQGESPAILFDTAVRIVKGGSIGSEDKSFVGAYPVSDSYQSYGGESDLWGESWEASDINASNFGCANAANQTGFGSKEARIDHVRITVYYTSAGGQMTTKTKYW